jgi:putative ABC transport system permease protein
MSNALLLAWRQLIRNRVRTALTSLGILIGVAAVICLVALGRGATAQIEQDLRAFGSDVLFVVPGNEGPGGRGAAPAFREQDAEALARLDGVLRVVPTAAQPVRAARGEQSWPTTAWGTTEGYFETLGWTLAQGRVFLPGELRAGSEVCVIGQTVGRELFGAQPAEGQRLRLGKLECRVIGVLASKGQNTFGQDQDDLVVLPLRTLQRRLTGNRDVTMMLVSGEPGVEQQAHASLVQDVQDVLRSRRHLAPGAEADFFVRDMAEALATMGQIMGVLTAFLGAVAAISLLVGGIGIMNIMMVSVTERTREIGVRLAIGATAGDILLQFLVESVVLAWVGGASGVLLGVALSWLASWALALPFVLDPEIIVLSFAVAGTIGVGFGYFPARRAARLNPIDALRHE